MHKRCFAVIGDPIQQSLSPRIFQLFAKQSGLVLDYQAIPVKRWDLTYALASFRRQGYQGINLTSPLKEKAFSLVDACSPAAQKAKAINMLYFREDGSYFGENYDGLGFIRDLQERQQFSLRGKSILLVGAGGAARGILAAIVAEKPQQVVIVNRSEPRAALLAKEFDAPENPVVASSWQDIPLASYDLVIQATTAGVHGEKLSLPTGILRPDACCYDLVYGAGHLSFLAWAKEQGAAICVDGVGMLVEQAAEAFYAWYQKRVNTAAIIAELRCSFFDHATEI